MKMISRKLLFIVVIFCIYFFSGCIRTDYYNWKTKLENGYIIGQFDKDIVQVRRNKLLSSDVVIPETIKEYTVSSEYVVSTRIA